MDFDATQVFDELGTVKRNNDENEKQIGSLCIGSDEYPIMEGFNRIGRSPMCRVILKDTTISKVHAEIQAGPEATFITNLGSANGTTLKSLPLKNFFFYPINDGDVIVFGRVSAVYKIKNKSSERSGDVTPKTPVRRSSKRHEDDLSIDDPNESVIPGSQQNVNKQRLFRRPAMPIDRQKMRGRISGIAEKLEKSKDSNVTGNESISTDIYDMETQDIVDQRRNVTSSLSNKEANVNVDKAKSINDTSLLASKIDDTSDIHDMETQDIINRGTSHVENVPDRTKSPNSPDVFAERADENIHDAETQLLSLPVDVTKKKLSILSVTENEDSNMNDEIIIESKEAKVSRNICEIIAETDDESGTDDETTTISKRPRLVDDLSDDSITDNENEFAGSKLKSVRVSQKQKKQQQQRAIPLSTKIQPARASPRSERKNLETNIHDAETQPMQDYPLRNVTPRAAAAAAARYVEAEQDIDLLPTQILDLASSTPISRMTKTQSNESLTVVTEDQDIHDALTQVAPYSDDKEDDERMKNLSKINNDKKTNDDDDYTGTNLNDTIDKNMGNIFGNEAISDVEIIDEPTQLMTQNLVDILKPTQIFAPEKSCSSVKSSNDEDDTSESSSPERKKINKSSGTLGFIDGRAIDSKSQVSTIPTTSMSKLKDLDEATSTTTDTTVFNEDDDILFGLPKVRISGTLSNPGSPTSSEGTSENNFVTDDLEKLRNNRVAVREIFRNTKESQSSGKNLANSGTRVGETCEPDSPVLSTKIRPKRKYYSRNRILEDDDDDDDDDDDNNDDDNDVHDSDDDLDYNDLKKIADNLLASDITNYTSVRRAPKNRGSLPIIKSVVAEKNLATTSRNRRKLSEKTCALTVTDDISVNDYTIDGNENRVDITSPRGTRKRQRQTGKNANTEKTPRTKKFIDESRGNNDNGETSETIIPGKTYAKVQLTRLNDDEVKTKKDSSVVAAVTFNLDTPKSSTRTRRLNSISTMELKSSPTSKIRGKNRRTTIASFATNVSQQHKILFTGVNDEDYEKIIVKLGGSVVADPSKASVLITDKIRRTFKFLCAVAQGIKVVSINWLLESNRAGNFLDCENFILQDPVVEEKYRFKLAKSLNIARNTKLLDGFTIIVTPKVNQPEIHEIKGMVEACGGRVLVRAGRSWDKKTVIISREDDLVAAKAMLAKAPKIHKITVQTTEFLLTGILRQEVNLVDHKLL